MSKFKITIFSLSLMTMTRTKFHRSVLWMGSKDGNFRLCEFGVQQRISPSASILLIWGALWTGQLKIRTDSQGLVFRQVRLYWGSQNKGTFSNKQQQYWLFARTVIFVPIAAARTNPLIGAGRCWRGIRVNYTVFLVVSKAFLILL